jgi:tRNA A-37 threonylcarbamoyl transferase component Bud32
MLEDSFQNKIRYGKDATASGAKFERDDNNITRVSRSWLDQGRRSKRTAVSVQPTGDVIIYCWPYHAVDAGDTSYFRMKSSKNDPIVWVVSIFGSIWLLSTLIMLSFLIGFHNFGGVWYVFKLVPFLLLPLFGMIKGLTHIRIAYDGVILQSSSGKSTLRSKRLLWQTIKRVYVDPPSNEKDLLSGKLVFDTTRGVTKIALRKIASAAQWRKLVGALSARVKVCDLDPALLDGLNRDRDSDPTYTKIWLEALTAPPLRERLQPLTQGIELQKGQYRIESCLGSGGQGSAYLVSTQGEKLVLKEYILPVYVDVKVKRKALEDFEHESRIMRSLNHPGIVKTRGSFVEDHRAYLVLEYVSGQSLKDIVEQHGPVSEQDCIRFGMEMCDILHCLHSQSPPVVHQDFTPDNLLLSADHSLKLIDFMVAKQSDSESTSNAVVGKHHYMPPEQFRGKATTRSDIYALGCTLHFILTGCKPEPMSTSHPTLQNENVSGGMTSIVEKATTLDEKLRYQHVLELKDDLDHLSRLLLT